MICYLSPWAHSRLRSHAHSEIILCRWCCCLRSYLLFIDSIVVYYHEFPPGTIVIAWKLEIFSESRFILTMGKCIHGWILILWILVVYVKKYLSLVKISLVKSQMRAIYFLNLQYLVSDKILQDSNCLFVLIANVKLNC